MQSHQSIGGKATQSHMLCSFQMSEKVFLNGGNSDNNYHYLIASHKTMWIVTMIVIHNDDLMTHILTR